MAESELQVREDEDGATFEVRVTPRARRAEIVGVLDGALKVKVAAPPVEGAANEALIAFLADALGVRRSQLEVRSGERSRLKTVWVGGMAAEAIRQRLLG